jgi:hypothetical protein
MEVVDPVSIAGQDTRKLLTVIIDELKSIGLILARQDERIEALSSAKGRVHPKDWDSVSVVVSFHYPRPFSPNHILRIGFRITIFSRFDFIQFHGIHIKYNIN